MKIYITDRLNDFFVQFCLHISEFFDVIWWPDFGGDLVFSLKRYFIIFPRFCNTSTSASPSGLRASAWRVAYTDPSTTRWTSHSRRGKQTTNSFTALPLMTPQGLDLSILWQKVLNYKKKNLFFLSRLPRSLCDYGIDIQDLVTTGQAVARCFERLVSDPKTPPPINNVHTGCLMDVAHILASAPVGLPRYQIYF